MSADLVPFDFQGQTVRTVLVDDAPWFVAGDVAQVLAYSATSAMTRTLDDDEKGLQLLHTLGGVQEVTMISEAGLYSAILRSRVPAARMFKRWVTHEVLPEIRRTGGFVQESREQLLARAVMASQTVIAEKDQRIAELEPSAQAWDELADGEGDYDVRAAAQILCRAGVDTGQKKLFAYLRSIRWTGSDNRPYQRHLQAGRLAEKVRTWTDRESGDRRVDHQLRITPKGLGELLAKQQGVPPDLQLIAGDG